MHIIIGHTEKMAALAARKLSFSRRGFGLCQAVGVATGPNPKDKLLAVCVYHDFQPEFGTCQVSIVSWSPKWAKRGIIRALLHIPFEQYGVKKLWSLMELNNKRAIKFNEGIGFKREAVLRHQFGANRHAVFTSMMEPVYRNRWKQSKSPRINSAVGIV